MAINAGIRSANLGSVVELSRRSNVSRNTIYGWTSGKHEPQFAQLSAVAGALDVPMAYLVDAWEGRLWPNPRTRDELPDSAAIEAQVEALLRAAIRRIQGEDEAPGKGRAQ